MAKGISIHIGLNHVDPKHYQGWDGALNACIADANDMRALAKKRIRRQYSVCRRTSDCRGG